MLVDRFKPKWILIDDLQVTSQDEFYSLQRYYGTLIPCRFYNLDKLCLQMAQSGYRKINVSPYPKSYSPGMRAIVDCRDGKTVDIDPPVTIVFERSDDPSFRITRLW